MPQAKEVYGRLIIKFKADADKIEADAKNFELFDEFERIMDDIKGMLERKSELFIFEIEDE